MKTRLLTNLPEHKQIIALGKALVDANEKSIARKGPAYFVLDAEGRLADTEGKPYTPDALAVVLRSYVEPGSFEGTDWNPNAAIDRRLTRGLLESRMFPELPKLSDQPVETGWEWVPLEKVSGEPARPLVGQRTDGACLFYRGKVNAAYGDSEGGKTWLCLLAAAQELVAGRSVAYLDYEDSAQGIKSRLHAMGVPEDIVNDPVMFKYANPFGPIGDMLASERFQEELSHCTLVVVDAMTEALSAAGMNSNSDVDVAHWFNTFAKPISDLGPAVIIIDHTPKAADNKTQQTGSQHKKSAIDGASIAVINKHKFVPGVAGDSLLQIGKDRPAGVRAQAINDGKDFGYLVMGAAGPSSLRIELPEPEQTDEEKEYALDYTISAIWDDLEAADEKTTVDDLKAAYRKQGHKGSNKIIEASIQRVREARKARGA